MASTNSKTTNTEANGVSAKVNAANPAAGAEPMRRR
jgi:hypothetical protein